MTIEKNDLLAGKIYNKTKSCILMWKFAEGTWGLPMISIPEDAVPSNHIYKLLNMICGHFELVSAVELIDYFDKDDEGNIYHSMIYDIAYSGIVTPQKTANPKAYHTGSKWVPVEQVKKKEPRTFTLFAYTEYLDNQEK